MVCDKLKHQFCDECMGKAECSDYKAYGTCTICDGCGDCEDLNAEANSNYQKEAI